MLKSETYCDALIGVKHRRAEYKEQLLLAKSDVERWNRELALLDVAEESINEQFTKFLKEAK